MNSPKNPVINDVDLVSRISVIPKMLDVIAATTGMGFVAVARVTEDRWITCSSRDDVDFGLKPGDELPIKTTICNQIRQNRKAVIINDVNNDSNFKDHQTPAIYGFQSYISMPVFRKNGAFFGTLCAIDPLPRNLDTPSTIEMFELFCDLISFHLDQTEQVQEQDDKMVNERLLHKEVEESKEQLAFAIEAAELGTFDYNPITEKFTANKRLREWFGLPQQEQVLLQHAIDSIAIEDRDRVISAIQNVLEFSNDSKYDVKYKIINPITKSETIVHAKGRAWFNEDKRPYHFNGTLEDITEQFAAQKKIQQTLSELELFKFAVENTTDYVGICDINFIPIYVNEEGMRTLGLESFDQVKKAAVEDFFFTEDIPFLMNDFFPSVLKNGRGETEIRFKHFKTSEPIWMIYNVVAVKDSHGRPGGFATVSKNITERKNTEDIVYKTSKRLELALEAGMLGSYELAIDTGIITCTAQCKTNFGQNPDDQLTYKQFLEMVFEEDKPAMQQAFEKSIQNNHIYDAVYRITTKDNEVRWIHSSALPIYDSNGKAVQMAGVTANITNQKTGEIKIANALEAVEMNRNKLKVIIDASGLGTWDFNVKTKDLHYSDKYLEIFGHEKESHPNHSELLSQIHPDDMIIRNKAFETAYQTGVFNYQARILWRDRSLHHIDVRGSLFFDTDDSPLYMIGTIRDITQEKAFNEELERKVHERTRQLEENNVALEKMNKELQSFAYISSHDLQEPLRKIQIFASRIVDREYENLSEGGRDYFRRMQNSAERMQDLINDLLAYSRSDATDSKFESTNLNAIIEDVKLDLKDELNQHDVIIDSGDVCMVSLIPFQFRQLLYNLVSNSIKFAKPGSHAIVKIKCEIGKGSDFSQSKLLPDLVYCHICVSDNGIGFEQKYAERIFELFQRLHDRIQYKGTGIGLAIVKKIIENHKGFIFASGVLGEGAAFDIYIPVERE